MALLATRSGAVPSLRKSNVPPMLKLAAMLASVTETVTPLRMPSGRRTLTTLVVPPKSAENGAGVTFTSMEPSGGVRSMKGGRSKVSRTPMVVSAVGTLAV